MVRTMSIFQNYTVATVDIPKSPSERAAFENGETREENRNQGQRSFGLEPGGGFSYIEGFRLPDAQNNGPCDVEPPAAPAHHKRSRSNSEYVDQQRAEYKQNHR